MQFQNYSGQNETVELLLPNAPILRTFGLLNLDSSLHAPQHSFPRGRNACRNCPRSQLHPLKLLDQTCILPCQLINPVLLHCFYWTSHSTCRDHVEFIPVLSMLDSFYRVVGSGEDFDEQRAIYGKRYVHGHKLWNTCDSLSIYLRN